MGDIGKSEQKTTSPGLSRRSFLKLVGATGVVLVLDRYTIGSFPEGEGSLHERTGILLGLLKNIRDAQTDKSTEGVLRSEEAERVLYLWSFCNAAEFGGRAKGYTIAADNVRHFLYGKGRPRDLSRQFGEYLKGEYSFDDSGAKEWRKVGKTGAGKIIASAIGSNLKSLGVQPINTSDGKEEFFRVKEEHIRALGGQSFTCVSRVSSHDDKKDSDWFYGVGRSTFRVSFQLGGKRISGLIDERGIKSYLVNIEGYDIDMNDEYNWGTEADFSAADFIDYFLRGLEIQLPLIERIKTQLHEIERRLFPGGLNESDIELLVRKGLAQYFPITAQAKDQNVNFDIIMPEFYILPESL